MKNTVIWSFLSVVALGTSGLVAGCDSDEKLARSALGESCAKTSDCDDGLRCLDGTCYKPATGTAGSSNGAGGDGTDVVGPKPPVLGGEGESCGRAADCEEGLGCFSGRCSKAEAGGEGGDGNVGGVKLGGVGETCGLTTDCEKGLTCLPSDGVLFPDALAIGSNSVGVCTPTDNGLEPTGKACGAECKEAADCCELPFETHAQIGAQSCTELAALLAAGDTNCAGAKLTVLESAQCFAQAAYCDCASKTWACEAGKCQYTASCSKTQTFPALVVGGCPQHSRAGNIFASTCDTAGTKKCQAAAGDPVCKTDANCVEKAMAFADPLAPTQVCGEDECTCYTPTGLCYRKCEEDLDCPANYTCDTDSSVCTPEAGCGSDAECVTRLNNIRAKCFDDGACEVGCDNDLECNFGSLTNGPQTRICNAQHRCELVGCTSDRECGATANGLRLFCGEKPTTAGDGAVTSAITD